MTASQAPPSRTPSSRSAVPRGVVWFRGCSRCSVAGIELGDGPARFVGAAQGCSGRMNLCAESGWRARRRWHA